MSKKSHRLDIRQSPAIIVLAILTLAGLLLRLYRLADIPLWNDECLQMDGVKMTFSDLRTKHLSVIEYMPPLSYLIQRLFWFPFQTEFAAKLPGALAGTLMIPLSYLTLRRITNRLGGLLAAFFTAFSFFLIWYSQELRAYIFFGLAIWACMAAWVDIVFTPINERVRWWKWVLLFMAGVLCGLFHFSALIFLPFAGGLGTLLLGHAYWHRRKELDFKPALRRWLALFIALIAAWCVGYIVMRLSVNPELYASQREGGYRPTLSETMYVLSKYSWGYGWRVIPFVLIMLCAWIPVRRGHWKVAALATLFVPLNVIAWFYVYPTFPNAWRVSASSRYLFWNAWGFTMAVAAGVYALTALAGRRRTAPAVCTVTALLLGYTLIHLPLFSHYYRMEAKNSNNRALREHMESLQEPRVMLMGQSYDMHNMRYSWPTNCLFVGAPVYNGNKDYLSLRVKDWVVKAIRLYPNTILQEDLLDSRCPQDELDDITSLFETTMMFTNRAGLYLADVGVHQLNLKPPYGNPKHVLYNSYSHLYETASHDGQDLLLYTTTLPLISTRMPDGAYSFWRVLHQPAELIIFNVSPTNRTVEFSLPIGAIGQQSEVLLAKDSRALTGIAVPESDSLIANIQQQQWMKRKLGLGEVAQISYRIPMQIQTVPLKVNLSLRPGINQFTLVPRKAASLIGEHSEEWQLDLGRRQKSEVSSQ